MENCAIGVNYDGEYLSFLPQKNEPLSVSGKLRIGSLPEISVENAVIEWNKEIKIQLEEDGYYNEYKELRYSRD